MAKVEIEEIHADIVGIGDLLGSLQGILSEILQMLQQQQERSSRVEGPGPEFEDRLGEIYDILLATLMLQSPRQTDKNDGLEMLAAILARERAKR